MRWSFLVGLLSLPVPAQDPPLRTVRGVVLDARDDPVAAARLAVLRGFRPMIDGDILLSGSYPTPAVLQQLAADGTGRFAVEVRMPGVSSYLQTPPVLAAWQGERCLGCAPLDLFALVPGEDLRIRGSGPEPACVRVLDPEGKPLADALVEAVAVRSGTACVVLPEPAAASLRARTDAEGRAALAGIAAGDLAAVRVVSTSCGEQLVAAQRDGTGLDEIRLRACGAVNGRLVLPGGAGGDAVPSGTFVRISTTAVNLKPGNRIDVEGRRTKGMARARCAPDGTFTVVQLASGYLNWEVELPEGVALRTGARTKVSELAAGAAPDVAIELHAAAWLAGVVREAKDGPGVPGVRVGVLNGGQFQFVTTGEDGRFRCAVAPGRVQLEAQDVAQRYQRPPTWTDSAGSRVEVAPGTAEVAAPPIELILGSTLRGRVVDAEGRGVADARVVATWSESVSMGSREHKRLAFCGADGGFALEGLQPGTQPNLSAAHRRGATVRPVPCAVDAALPVTLPVVDAATLLSRVEGSVLDRDGRPVAGATVRLVSMRQPPGNQGLVLEDVPVEARTDAAGRFTLAGNLATGCEYAVRASCPGSGPGGLVWGASGWARLAERGPLAVGRVMLAPESPATRPAAASQQAPASRASLPPLPEARAHALAMSLLTPLVAAVVARGEASDRLRTLETLATVSPADALATLDQVVFPDPFYPDLVRKAAAEGLGATDLDAALMVHAAKTGADRRCWGYLELLAKLPATDTTRRQALLGEALQEARATPSPQMRLVALAKVAASYLEQGDELRARTILIEAAPIARDLPTRDWPQYARSVFAVQLGLIDLPAALQILAQNKDEFEWDRQHGNLAHALAGRDPAAAEEVFGRVKNPDRMAQRVCWRMARVDRDRARRIAEQRTTTATARAECLGAMAHALAEVDRAAAGALLETAFALAEKEHAAVLAATLLVAAQRIDPDQVRPLAQRALRCRAAQARTGVHEHLRTLDDDAQLAIALLRFDRAAGEAALQPVRDALGFVLGAIGTNQYRAIVPALVLADPEPMATVIAALPEDEDLKFHRRKNYARLSAAKVLLARGDAGWDWLQSHYLTLWTVDKEDL